MHVALPEGATPEDNEFEILHAEVMFVKGDPE